MKINTEIIKILSEEDIDIDKGLNYLVCKFFNLKVDLIPIPIQQKVIATNIFEDKNNKTTWNVPLFGSPGVDKAWDWVQEEYIPLFSKIGKGSYKRETLKRMKKLFSEFPHIRKEDVLGATEMYLLNTKPQFIRQPHYFIEKGVGTAKTQDILEWIDTYNDAKENVIERDNYRRLQ